MSVSRLAAISLLGLCCLNRYGVDALGKLKQKHFTEEETIIEQPAEPAYDQVIHREPVMGTVTEEWAPPVFYKQPKYELEKVPIYYKEKIPVYHKGKEHHLSHYGMHYHDPHMAPHSMNAGVLPPHSINAGVPSHQMEAGVAPPHPMNANARSQAMNTGMIPSNSQMTPPINMGDHPNAAPHDVVPHEMAYSQFNAPQRRSPANEPQVRPFNYGTPSYASGQRYPTVQVSPSSSKDDDEIEWVHAPFLEDNDVNQHKYYITEQHYEPRYVVAEQPVHAYVPVRCGLDKMCLRLL